MMRKKKDDLSTFLVNVILLLHLSLNLYWDFLKVIPTLITQEMVQRGRLYACEMHA